jgi:hypothetical protein
VVGAAWLLLKAVAKEEDRVGVPLFQLDQLERAPSRKRIYDFVNNNFVILILRLSKSVADA